VEAKQKKIAALKVLLWLGAVYHIPFPLVAMFNKTYVPIMANQFYGFNITITPQIAWLLNPLAAYMLAFGLFLAVAATDPIKYIKMIYAVLFLLLIRIIQRALFISSGSGEYISGDSYKIILDFCTCVLYWIAIFVMAKKVTCEKCA